MSCAPTQSAATPVFADCAGRRLAYPFGVIRPGAANTGKKPRGALVIDRKVYRANAGLDREQDGIACERTKPAGGSRG
jgi:hypothetical protein